MSNKRLEGRSEWTMWAGEEVEGQQLGPSIFFKTLCSVPRAYKLIEEHGVAHVYILPEAYHWDTDFFSTFMYHLLGNPSVEVVTLETPIELIEKYAIYMKSPKVRVQICISVDGEVYDNIDTAHSVELRLHHMDKPFTTKNYKAEYMNETTPSDYVADERIIQ